MFVAVHDRWTYAGTKVCRNDNGNGGGGWTIHHCNTTPMWGLMSLRVLIEH